MTETPSDSAIRLTETDPFGNVTTYGYAGYALYPESVTYHEAATPPAQPVSTTVHYSYDAQGRVTRARRDGDGLTVYQSYDEVGNPISSFLGGAHPQRTVMSWDSAGRVVAVNRAGGRQTDYGYDPDGRLVLEETTTSTGIQTTHQQYDTSGRLRSRTIPGQLQEVFSYNLDDTMDVWTTPLTNDGGTQLRLKHAYDDAGRLVRRQVDNPADFYASPDGLAAIEDVGDAVSYDRLGRVTRLDRVLATGGDADPSNDVFAPGHRVSFGYRDQDPRDLPKTEALDAYQSFTGETASLDRMFGPYGDLRSFSGANGIGEFSATSDDLLRRSSVSWSEGDPATANAHYSWSGQGRLQVVDVPDLDQHLVNSFSSPGARLASRSVKLGGLDAGTWSYRWDGASDLKSARDATASAGGLELLSGLGWAWQHAAGARLRHAETVSGAYEFGYGPGDELLFTKSSDGLRAFGSPGPLGRPTSISSTGSIEVFEYDSVGRRTADGRYRYLWTWRGELAAVEVVDSHGDPTGERVIYEYDASGRLIKREHQNADGDFVDAAFFVWNGQELTAQVGVNHDDQPLWQVEYLPGPVGLDDSVVARVTSLTAGPETRVFHLIRDEMGSVVAVVDAPTSGVSPEDVGLRGRVLYTPYGKAKLEQGPTLLAVEHELERTTLAGVDQAGVAFEIPPDDPESEPEPTGVPGAMVFTFSIGIDESSIGDTIRVLRWIDDTATWEPILDGIEKGLDPESPNKLVVMPHEPWPKGGRFTVELAGTITDVFGRSAVFPGDAPTYSADVVVPDSVVEPFEVFTGYPLTIPVEFDSAVAARATLDCGDDAPCFPGGLATLFQGLYHDPLTGLAYARNRWYDARTAHWLSPDPMGAFDSPNQYAFVGWRPHMARDPMGTCIGADWECWGWVAQDLFVNANFRPGENALRAAGGAVGFGKFVGETVYDLGSLTADTFLMRAPGLNLGQRERMAQRGEGIGQLLSNPGGAIKGSFTRMADNVLAHEQAGEYFQSGMVAGEYGSAAGATVVGGFEAGVGVARLARVGVSSARRFSLNLGRGGPVRGAAGVRTPRFNFARSGAAGQAGIGEAAVGRAGLLTRARRFFWDPRDFRVISREYWAARGGANGRSLHHYMFPQRSYRAPMGVRNAGFNLIDLPPLRGVFHRSLGLNQWMGFARNWGPVAARNAAAVENTIRWGIPVSAGGAGAGGYLIGSELYDWIWGER